MSHYNSGFVQTDQTCGACTLMIALYEFGVISSVDHSMELKLFDGTGVNGTCDQHLSKALGAKKAADYISSPANMRKTAESYGITAELYIDKKFYLPDPAAGPYKTAYIDTLSAQEKYPIEMAKAFSVGCWQILTNVGSDWKAMHWLLLREDKGKYYLYDTAFGKNYVWNFTPTVLMACGHKFSTGRSNTSYGIAFHLTK